MTYETDLLTTTPTGYWPCDDGTGTTLADVSGNGLNLPLSGFADFGSWVADPLLSETVVAGNYLNYSTTDPCAWSLTAATIDPGEPWTVSGWVRNHPGNYDEDAPASFPDGLFELRASVWTGSTSITLLEAVAQASDQTDLNPVAANNGNASAYASNYARPWLDDWVHVYAENDGTTVTAYVDGSVAATATAAAPGTLGSVSLTVELIGRMAHLAVWDRVLDASEKALVGTFPGPPPPPSTAPWDDFDRADAASLGTASTVGLAWGEPIGSWAIASNTAEPTSLAGSSSAALAVLPSAAAGLLAPEAVSVAITTPGSGAWFGGIAQGGGGTFAGMAVVASDDGTLAAIRWVGDGSVVGIDSTSVDVSAGAHDLTISLVEEDGPPGSWLLMAWWDGVLYLETAVSGGYLPNGAGDVGLLAYDTDATTLVFDNLGVALAPLELGEATGIPDPESGVLNWPYDPDIIFAPSVPAPLLTSGVLPWPGVNLAHVGPIYAASVGAPPLYGGVHSTWSDTPDPPDLPRPDETPWPPGYQYGPPTAELSVSGFPYRTDASCQPQFNGPGTGSFTTLPPGPGLGDTISYTSGGGIVFTGTADEITTIVADSGEESGQLVRVTTPGKLGLDWGDTIVYPDFGASDPIRVGQPPQDDRIFGFPMNGLNVPGLTWTTSVGGDNARYGTEEEIFPLPDNWPDIRSRWMWVTNPDVESQPGGWCYFRKPFGSWPGTFSLFVCAYDYARVYIDGVLVTTVESSGSTKRVELDFDWDYHLIAIEAYAVGGTKAGVLVSMLQRNPTNFGGAGIDGNELYSEGGWKALAYPTVSMRATVGKVLMRLVQEAGARGAPAGNWACGFTEDADSNGRSWPTGEDAMLITLKVGSTYMDVLNQLSESHIDYHASANGGTLMAYVKDTVSASVGVPWTHTVDAESLSQRVAGH